MEKKKPQNIDHDYTYRFLIESLEDYGILIMDTKGHIVSWNTGAKSIFGYKDKEVIGKHVSIIFSNQDRKIKIPALEITTATKKGRADDERQHRRKDGSLFWASGVMWAIKDDQGNLRGLSKLIRDISERKTMEDTIRHQSLHDTLTGLPNRRSFEDRLALAMLKAKANKSMLAVMFFDIDNFKKINDTHGHDSGDILLQEIATRLSLLLRKGDTISRIGGDEFIILIDNINQIADIHAIIKKLVGVLRKPFNISNKKILVTVSVGVSFYPTDGKSSRILKKRADIALYRAKESGKNCYKIYNEKK
jgi:diguanylate cyclase (GGDEF)-like protein/PAS domain S-box-containing protein